MKDTALYWTDSKQIPQLSGHADPGARWYCQYEFGYLLRDVAKGRVEKIVVVSLDVLGPEPDRSILLEDLAANGVTVVAVLGEQAATLNLLEVWGMVRAE